jgi:hypothetical protein
MKISIWKQKVVNGNIEENELRNIFQPIGISKHTTG